MKKPSIYPDRSQELLTLFERAGNNKKVMYVPIDYAKSMKYSSNLARWLHKRISHQFVQASWNNTDQIRLSTIICDSGITSYAQLRNNLREATKALDEMVELGVLCSYDDTNRKMNGKCIIDVTFELKASHEFVAGMKKSHA